MPKGFSTNSIANMFTLKLTTRNHLDTSFWPPKTLSNEEKVRQMVWITSLFWPLYYSLTGTLSLNVTKATTRGIRKIFRFLHLHSKSGQALVISLPPPSWRILHGQHTDETFQRHLQQCIFLFFLRLILIFGLEIPSNDFMSGLKIVWKTLVWMLYQNIYNEYV
jgi:hypothetical protein